MAAADTTRCGGDFTKGLGATVGAVVADDHELATHLGTRIAALSRVERVLPVDTNIAIFM